MARQSALKQTTDGKKTPDAPSVQQQRAQSVLTKASNAAKEQPRSSSSSPVELDRLIHERLRLGIVSALAANKILTFNDLKRLMNTTDGNLSVHARKLEDAGYIECVKSFDGRIPKTEYSLTIEGRRALERYLNHMEALINQMREL